MSDINILFDIEVVNNLKLKNIEFITNSFTNIWFQKNTESLKKINMTELLVIDNIPNYLSPKGPYHPCVEKARESKNLKAYRKWIVENSNKSDTKEFADIKMEVENEIKKAQDKIFLKYLDPKTSFSSAGKTILGTALDLVTSLPLSAGTSLLENLVNLYIKKINVGSHLL